MEDKGKEEIEAIEALNSNRDKIFRIWESLIRVITEMVEKVIR